MALGITSIFDKKRPILCVTEKKHQKGNPHIGSGIPELVSVKIPNLGIPEPVWGLFQFGDQHIYVGYKTEKFTLPVLPLTVLVR